MRRVGLVCLALGLAGFLLASGARDARPGWETARWLFVGVAVTGFVFTVLPGKTRGA
jgi:hypothetical protein